MRQYAPYAYCEELEQLAWEQQQLCPSCLNRSRLLKCNAMQCSSLHRPVAQNIITIGVILQLAHTLQGQMASGSKLCGSSVGHYGQSSQVIKTVVPSLTKRNGRVISRHRGGSSGRNANRRVTRCRSWCTALAGSWRTAATTLDGALQLLRYRLCRADRPMPGRGC